MATLCQLRVASLPIFYVLFNTAAASPISYGLLKRDMTSGAKAGLGIGIAVAVIIVLLIAVFFAVHVRRRARNQALNDERAILAGEKNPDGTDKIDKYAPEPQRPMGPKRNKSVKDRLMGPLYRGSMIDLPDMPQRAKIPGANNSNRASTMTMGSRASWMNKPWTNIENSPRPSFSSKRATRMMMMM